MNQTTFSDLNSTSQQRQSSTLLRRRLIDVTLTLRVCCPPTYIAFRPKFDALTTSNFGVVTTEVDRRYIDVACMLSTYVRCLPTYT